MTDGPGSSWQLYEETRVYAGVDHATAAAAFDAGLEEALRERYLPESIAWADDGCSVTVTYVHDPIDAPRPV